MEEHELKPCPFCAAEYPHIMLNDRGAKAGMWRYFVECLNCESKTGIYKTKEGAMQAWERRAFRGIDIMALLAEYKSRKTYTDCEEHRRQGAVEVLERMIEMLSSNEN